MTEIFIERALARAKEVDDYLANTGTTLGPLHGLPISLKDQFAMKGLETVMGMNIDSNHYVLIQLWLHRLCIVDRKFC